jgi:cysteine-rich repeat protein
VCKAAVCEANKTYCDGQALKVCNADGLAGVLVKTCGPAEICEGGTCKTKACPASQPVCDGNTAKVCNATGTGYTGPGQDCGSQKCSGGVCKAVVCKAASQYCEGGQLKTCSPDGTAVTAQSACPLGTYCGLGKSGDAGCQQMVCNPGQPSCDGTKAAMCNTEGSGFTGAATDCAASGKVCSAGVCTALKCDPQNVLYCEGGAAKKCENGGMTVTTLQTCTASQYCDKGVCQAQVCTPGAAGCNGQTAATCNAQGSGWLPGGVDCAASGKACQAGSCVVTQVCGNGKFEFGETCDDGNLKNGDGCSSTCTCDVDGALKTMGNTCTDTGCGWNGANKMASLPISEKLSGLTSFTIEAWIRQDATSQYGQGLFSNNFGSLGLMYMGDIGYGGMKGKFGFSVGPATTYAKNVIPLGKWFHFAGVVDNGQVRMYLDGALQGQASGAAAKVAPIVLGEPMYVGGNPSNGNGNSNLQFNGMFRSVRISAKALYVKDFTPDTTLTASSDTLQLWGFDEGSGTQTTDSVSGVSGALVNGANWEKVGPFSPCQAIGASPVCGNSVQETGEGCDDGNTLDGDKCGATCQLTVPQRGLVDASGGWRTSCALFNGQVKCWGDDAGGVVSKAPAGTLTQIAVGEAVACGIKPSGELLCWGDDQVGTISKAPKGSFIDIECGSWFCCGLGTDKLAKCWGVDAANPVVNAGYTVENLNYGQVASTPTNTKFTQITARRLQACGLTEAGQIVCWGRNDYGQVSGVPVGTYKSVDMGGGHACAVRTDGSIKCWGKADKMIQPPVGTFVQLDMGDQHACAIKADGSGTCWGNATDSRVNVPPLKFVEIRASEVHSCGMMPSGQPICWGCDILDKGQCKAP